MFAIVDDPLPPIPLVHIIHSVDHFIIRKRGLVFLVPDEGILSREIITEPAVNIQPYNLAQAVRPVAPSVRQITGHHGSGSQIQFRRTSIGRVPTIVEARCSRGEQSLASVRPVSSIFR